MTLLGKILVFVNFTLSMLAAAWACALYSTSVDWSGNPAKGDQPPGELAVRKNRLQELQAGLRPAEARWRDARAAVLGYEEARNTDRLWYLARMDHLRTGATEANPAQAVVVFGDLPQVDPATGRLRMEAVKAWVVLRGGQNASEQELRTYCREHLAPFKVPSSIEFRTELPKTMVGKVLRRALRDESAK